jgi:HlyD family secretion protein
VPPPTFRRWAVRAAIAAGIVAVGLLVRVTLLAPAVVPVEAAIIERGRVEQTVTNSRAGTVKARRRAQLSPEAGGRVIEIAKREGDRVRQGEVLLRLDPSIPAARHALALREQQVAVAERSRACLAAERAGRERDRNRRLAAQGIVSADVLDGFDSAARTAAAACEAAQATEQRAAAAIELAERRLELAVLRAPFDGIVAELSIEVGEWSTPSPPALPVPAVLDVLDPTSIYVSAPMDEVDSARIRPELPARVSVDSHQGEHFPGHVHRVAAFVLDVEEQNRTVEIEVELDAATFAATLLPGTSADVEVILETRDDVLRVPTSAVLVGNRVLIVDGRRLAERQITVGIRNWDWTEVQAGLAEGEAVVVSLDRAEVRAGARATVTSAPAP